MNGVDSKTKLNYYLSLEYPMILNKDAEEDLFFIEFPDLPGALAHGKNLNSAIRLANQIKKEWIKDALEKGYSIPLPKKEEDYSGKFVVRIPPAIHRRLSEQAEREGRSLNQHVGILLSERSAAISLENSINLFELIQENLEKNVQSLEKINESIAQYSIKASVLKNYQGTTEELTSWFGNAPASIKSVSSMYTIKQ